VANRRLQHRSLDVPIHLDQSPSVQRVSPQRITVGDPVVSVRTSRTQAFRNPVEGTLPGWGTIGNASWAATGGDKADDLSELGDLDLDSDDGLDAQPGNQASGQASADIVVDGRAPSSHGAVKESSTPLIFTQTPGGPSPEDLPEHFAVKGPPASSLAVRGPRTAMLVNGSRGDVQPYVALALELQKKKHKVVIYTCWDLVDFCVLAGVKAVATFPSCRDVIWMCGGMKESDPETEDEDRAEDWFLDVEVDIVTEQVHAASRTWLQQHPGLVIDPFEALVTFKPTVVLYTPNVCLTALRYEKQHSVPGIPVYLNCTLRGHGGLEVPPRPWLYATSEAVDPLTERSSWHHVTGAWTLIEEIPETALLQGGPLASLNDFINAGAPPVAIGWSSIIPRGRSPIWLLGLALRALQRLDKRGVILGGWARLHECGQRLLAGGLTEIGRDHASLRAFATRSVFFAPHAPHSWLFERCECSVHHGGAGTTHSAIRAGCPSVVTPIFFDQFYFAHRVNKLNAGVGFMKAVTRLEAQELATAIQEASSGSSGLRKLSRQVGKDGATCAAEVLDDFLSTWVTSGKWRRQLKL